MLNIILRNILIISTMLTLSTFASAQTTYTKIGGITFGSDGTSSTINKVGNTTFINSSTGSTTTIQEIGNILFTNSDE